jgi:hypothetical protein
VNLFPPYANQILWIALGLLTAAALMMPTAMIAWARTPYATGAGRPPVQPVKFDHRHHVRDDGVTCDYCHSGAFDSPHAGIPSTSLCMNCHAQIWPSSPELEPVRHSYFTDEPIHWQRVNLLPDFVFFNHSAHVTHCVGCVTCHGRIDQMAQVRAAQPLTMRWCMDCHRDPAPFLRPLDTITDMEWQPGPGFSSRDLQAQLEARSLVHCSTCHR